jgi:hypothetical protein
MTAKTDQFQGMIPAYPKVFDYYKIDRIIGVGVTIPDEDKWNKQLGILLRDLGPAKQANINIVVAKTSDRSYRYALENAWFGGKKNDIVVVLGSPNGKDIAFVEIISWSKSEMFTVVLRDELQALNTIEDFGAVLTIVADVTKEHFVRRPMAEFEYLEEEIIPPMWVVWTMLIFGSILSGVLTFVMHRKQLFN